MTKKDLQDFFNSHQAIKLNQFAKEAGMSYDHIYKVVKEDRELSEKTAQKMLPVMKKYGYKG